MGFFSDLTAMRDDAKKGRETVAADHRGRGYDVLPGRMRGHVCIWLLLWHMLMAGVYGFVAFWLLRPAWHGGTASGWIVFGALAVVPIWLCLGALRRCGETVLSRYDLYGGVVTDRNREKHVHRDTDDGHEHRPTPTSSTSTESVTRSQHGGTAPCRRAAIISPPAIAAATWI